MNLARARRRWRAWARHNDRCIKLDRGHAASRGGWKAYNERARWRNRLVNRQAERDAQAVLEALNRGGQP